MLKNIFTILEIIAGWAMIGLIIEGLTGWGQKGEYKKLFIADLLAIPIIAIIYLIIDHL